VFLIHVANSQYRAVFILQQTAIWTGRGVHSPIHNAWEEHPDLFDRPRCCRKSSSRIFTTITLDDRRPADAYRLRTVVVYVRVV
jgi:hypothetical protein